MAYSKTFLHFIQTFGGDVYIQAQHLLGFARLDYEKHAAK
jgi:hypothetical protein